MFEINWERLLDYYFFIIKINEIYWVSVYIYSFYLNYVYDD